MKIYFDGSESKGSMGGLRLGVVKIWQRLDQDDKHFGYDIEFAFTRNSQLATRD